MKCPRCKSDLVQQDTVKVRSNIKTEVVGQHLFCKNMDCTYEVDLDGKKV